MADMTLEEMDDMLRNLEEVIAELTSEKEP
jgi:hypothetical protein